jgi:hypothetical protein
LHLLESSGLGRPCRCANVFGEIIVNNGVDAAARVSYPWRSEFCIRSFAE